MNFIIIISLSIVKAKYSLDCLQEHVHMVVHINFVCVIIAGNHMHKLMGSWCVHSNNTHVSTLYTLQIPMYMYPPPTSTGWVTWTL